MAAAAALVGRRRRCLVDGRRRVRSRRNVWGIHGRPARISSTHDQEDSFQIHFVVFNVFLHGWAGLDRCSHGRLEKMKSLLIIDRDRCHFSDREGILRYF